jgi:8-oxo-dGTP pyrophosphatase MutT (NUDIX family)
MPDGKVVQAAGGVVARRDADRGIEVLLIHRPRRDDWTFPKGKLEPGEGWKRCALREVEEETGLRCNVGDELPSTTYFDRKGRLKVVRYWIMRAPHGEATPRNEVDAVRWVSITQAARILTYDYDRKLLEAFAATFPQPHSVR